MLVLEIIKFGLLKLCLPLRTHEASLVYNFIGIISFLFFSPFKFQKIIIALMMMLFVDDVLNFGLPITFEVISPPSFLV